MAIKNAAKFRAELFKNLEKACNFHNASYNDRIKTSCPVDEYGEGVTEIYNALVFESYHFEHEPFKVVIDKKLFVTVCDYGRCCGDIDLWQISEDGKFFELYASVPTCLYTATQMQMRAAILVETYFSK